jgi:threonine dehydrogenase-like Zn-dependent dehydrogenase
LNVTADRLAVVLVSGNHTECVITAHSLARHPADRDELIDFEAPVVIVGCGFGGLAAAKALRLAPVDVTVIDRTNHHLVPAAALPDGDGRPGRG